MICPACDCSEILKKVKHTNFGSDVYVCANCKHGWTDYDKVFESDSVFHTQKERADDYSKSILTKVDGIGSIFEIGSASDFYFLKKVHKLNPDIRLYLMDSFDYFDLVPDYINFVKSIDDVEDVDITYMSHVLEHIGDVNGFLQKLKLKSKYLFLEIPCKDLSYFQEGFKSAWHYQFFNEKSFNLIMKKNAIDILEFSVHMSPYVKKCRVIYAFLNLRGKSE